MFFLTWFQHTPACSCPAIEGNTNVWQTSNVHLSYWQSKTLLIPASRTVFMQKERGFLTSQTVRNVHAFLAACITSQLLHVQSVGSVSINMSFFLSLCLLDEPSVLRFGSAINKVLLFVPHSVLLQVSRLFWLHKQDCSVFADTKYWWEHLFFILASSFILRNKISVSPNRIVPHLHLVLPDSVTDASYSSCICVLIHYLMPVSHLCNNSLSSPSTQGPLSCYDSLYC